MWEVVSALLRPAALRAVGAEGLFEQAPAVRVREVFRRFWLDARAFRGWFALSLLLVVLVPLLDAAAIWLFKILIDDVLTPHDFAAFPAVAAAYAGITLLSGVIGFADQYLAAWIGENFLHRLRTRVFAHLHTLSVSFFDRRRLGDTLARLTGDVGAIENLVLGAVAQTASALIKIGLFGAVLFYLNWQLALLSLIAVPGFWLVARVFSRRIKTASREVRHHAGSMSVVAEESLSNVVLIQAYGREQAEISRFATQSRGSVGAVLAATRLGALFSSVVDVLEAVGVLGVVAAGIWELSAGRISLGGLLVFLVYLAQLYDPVRSLGQLSNTVFAAAAGGERLLDLLDQHPTVAAPARPVQLSRSAGRLQFNCVGFSYPDTPTRPDTDSGVVHEISFTALPGQTTAIVGASGAGKTTLLKLLLRLYDPDTGHITLNGTDLRALDPAQLRADIAVVLQETLLLDATIAENILAGRPGAGYRELTAAARAADAHEFITALPQGYHTRVGQRGRLLSGGQRQRIAIARAIIRDARILLLDEPTTSLDAEAGRRILAPLRRLTSGRTTILISHDLRTVTDAQQILYLDHGRITETGTHSQLLAHNDRYTRLYHLHQAADART
jgi:ABC-type multidrug transport system fused ATPase/permease subunit